MSHFETLTLLAAYQRDKEVNLWCRNRIIDGNINLIIWQAHKFLRDGQDLDDLVAVGTLGFAEGLDKFRFLEGAVGVVKNTPGQHVLVFSRQRPANYALRYSRKRLHEYIDRTLPTVAVGDWALRQTRTAIKELDRVQRSSEFNYTIYDVMAGRSTAVRLDALDLMKGAPVDVEQIQRSDDTETSTPDPRLRVVLSLLTPQEQRLMLAYMQDQVTFQVACIEQGLSESAARRQCRDVLRSLAEDPRVQGLRRTIPSAPSSARA